MQDYDLPSKFTPIDLSANKDSHNPVRGWKKLSVIGEDEKGRVIENYARAEESETSSLQMRFARSIAEVVMQKYINADEISVIDMSANDLNVTLAFCKNVMDMTRQSGKGLKNITVWANDLSYKDHAGLVTGLAKRAELAIQNSGDVGRIIQSPLIGKEATDVVEGDVGSQKLDVIWDRLGAMWHTIGKKDISEVKHLLESYRDLLKNGGILIFDGIAPELGAGFDTDNKLMFLLKENGFDDGWYAELGFIVTRERRDGQKLMILGKM